MPKVKKAGRPPLAKGDARSKFIRIRVTPEEFRAIEKTSKAQKQTVSEWIRSTLNAAT
jgi:predicted HicB family RNase H-like nuclease